MNPVLYFGDARRADLITALQARIGPWWLEWAGRHAAVPTPEMLPEERPRASIEERICVALRDGEQVHGVVEGPPSLLSLLHPAWYDVEEPGGRRALGQIERSIVDEMLGDLLRRISGPADRSCLVPGLRAGEAFPPERPAAVFRLPVAAPWHEVRCWLGATLVDGLLGPRPPAPAAESPVARHDCLGDLGVELDGVIGEARIGWSELQTLQVGDVIVTDASIDAAVTLSMRGTGRGVGRGALGQQGGVRVIRVDTGV